MARKGIFRRILDFFRGAPEAPRQPPPPPPPPPPPIIPPEPSGDPHEEVMEDIFVNISGGLTGNNYLEWREVFEDISQMFDTDEEVERYWDLFLRAYYLTSREAGSIPRKRFHQMTGAPYDAVDWDLWREIKRGTT